MGLGIVEHRVVEQLVGLWKESIAVLWGGHPAGGPLSEENKTAPCHQSVEDIPERARYHPEEPQQRPRCREVLGDLQNGVRPDEGSAILDQDQGVQVIGGDPLMFQGLLAMRALQGRKDKGSRRVVRKDEVHGAVAEGAHAVEEDEVCVGHGQWVR